MSNMKQQRTFVSKNHDIILSGYYGMSNTGDDCFCSIASWGATHIWQMSKLYFLSSSIPVLPILGKPIFSPTKKIHGQKKFELLYHLTKTPRLIFAGGSIFHGHEGWEREFIFAYDKIKPLKMGAIGVSLGPYNSQRDQQIVKNMLSRLTFLVLRDHKSFAEACTMNLPYEPILAFDLAGLLPLVYGRRDENISEKKRKPILAVIPCYFERFRKIEQHKEIRRTQLFIKTLQIITQRISCSLRIFTFNGHPEYGDTIFINNIKKVLSNNCDIEIIPYSTDPGYIWKKIGHCDAVFSIRLHGALFACMAGIPFCLVEYHQKCRDILEYLRCPDDWRIGDMDINPEEAAQKIIDMLLGNYPYPIDINRLEENALLNFTKVVHYFNVNY